MWQLYSTPDVIFEKCMVFISAAGQAESGLAFHLQRGGRKGRVSGCVHPQVSHPTFFNELHVLTVIQLFLDLGTALHMILYASAQYELLKRLKSWSSFGVACKADG